MSDVNAGSEKESYLLVEFTFESEAYRYTNLSTTIDPSGANYQAMPAMEVNLPANSGTMEDSEAVITLPLNSDTEAFLEPLSRGTPFAPVRATIDEVIRPLVGGETATVLRHISANISRTVRNPNNRKNLVEIYVKPAKNKLDKTMGLPCNHECPWTLYSFPCRQGAVGPDKNSSKKLVTLTAINGRTITVSGSYTLTPAERSYRFGWVEYGEARAGIRDWGGGNTLQLTRQLPVEWIGETISLIPGCDHSIENCRAAWNNEAHFGGIGFAIPAHNPVIETPAGFEI